jgi:hypothetical protein
MDYAAAAGCRRYGVARGGETEGGAPFRAWFVGGDGVKGVDEMDGVDRRGWRLWE